MTSSCRSHYWPNSKIERLFVIYTVRAKSKLHYDNWFGLLLWVIPSWLTWIFIFTCWFVVSFPVIYFCEYDGIRPFMIRACVLGMCNGEYVFIYPWLLLPVNDGWRRGDQYDVIAKEAYKHVIHVIYYYKI